MDATIAAMFARLGEPAQDLLPLLGLFRSRVSAVTAARLMDERSAGGAPPDAFTARDWASALRAAATVGLITPVGDSVYELPAETSEWLLQRLTRTIGQEAVEGLKSALATRYALLAATLLSAVEACDSAALATVAVERDNLERALSTAAAAGEWLQCQVIARALWGYLEYSGYRSEAAALYERLGAAVEQAGAEGSGAGFELWMHVQTAVAYAAVEAGSLDEAEARYETALRRLRERWVDGMQGQEALIYHQLGMIAQERGLAERAGEWYRQSLALNERLGDDPSAAADYHQLGMLAAESEQYRDAESWYLKALDIRRRLGLERPAVTDYHQLAMLAQRQEHCEEAYGLYLQALGIADRLGLQREAASAAHQLGVVCWLSGRFEEAEKWHRRALPLFERLGMDLQAAMGYHHMGLVAREQGRREEAEAWHLRALEQFTRLDLRDRIGDECYQLARIAEFQEHDGEAEVWYCSAVEAFRQLQRPDMAVSPLALLGLLRARHGFCVPAVANLGEALAIALQHEMPVAATIRRDLALLLLELGEECFAGSWREAFGGAQPPEELMSSLREVAGGPAEAG